MVVKRSDLFKEGIWHGIKTDDLKKYINLIFQKNTFLPRKQVEESPFWQQIIPYVVFETEGKIFLMRRKKDHADSRLSHLYSIGVGGHLNKKDIRTGDIFLWAKREFEEEIAYSGNYEPELLGLINDDSNDVGLVHLGMVIKFVGDSQKISALDEHKSGKLVRFKEAGKYYKQMETWSQIVYDFLKGSGDKKVQKGRKSEKSEMISAGIMPDWVIVEYIKKGSIKISPLPENWQEKIDQVSVDFHLGTHIKLFRSGAYRFVDTKRGLPEDAMEEVNLKEGDPFILEPGAFAITSTREVLKLPADVVGRLEGKSSLARLGILVHSTAARFDPGWNGAPVLELGNLGPRPAILYSGMPICAFTFEKLSAPVKMLYEGSRSDRYSGSKIAVASKIHRSFKGAKIAKRGRPRKK